MGRASLRDGIRHNIPCTLLYAFLTRLGTLLCGSCLER